MSSELSFLLCPLVFTEFLPSFVCMCVCVATQVYKVTFKDGPSLSLERSEFYLMDEPLPKKVRESLFQSPIATSSTPTS